MAKKKAKKVSVKKTGKKKVVKKATRTMSKKVAKKATKKVAKKPASMESMMQGLKLDNGAPFSLESYRGKKVVLYFYPKDDTPGCTIEGNEFNSLLKDFENVNTVILGVSRDSAASHQKFIQKFKFNFNLVSDPGEELCNRFDVIKDKNMYGKMVKGIERSTFVFDEAGNKIQEWRKVRAEGHAAEVLHYVKSLS